MKIHYVTVSDETLASYRMRIELPEDYLNKISKGGDYKYLVSHGPKPREDVDINVFTKHFNPVEDIKSAQYLKKKGKKTIIDICDDYFERPGAEYYLSMLETCDAVTCSSKNLTKKVKEISGRKDVFHVKDPCTFDFCEPSLFKPKEYTISYLWYGRGYNLFSLKPLLPHLTDGPVAVFSEVELKTAQENVHWLKWEPGIVEINAKNFFVVLIPTFKHDKATKNKSPNRVVDALFSGCFVVTDNEDIYEEFSDFIWIGDIIEGVDWFKKNPKEALKMIKRGQDYIEKNYTIESAVKRWLTAFEHVTRN